MRRPGRAGRATAAALALSLGAATGAHAQYNKTEPPKTRFRVGPLRFSPKLGVMDRITGRPGSGHRARRAVSLLHARGLEVVVKTPVMTLNRDAVAGIAAWAESIGATFRAFPVIVARRDGDPAPLALRVGGEELREFLAGPHYDCGEARAGDAADPSSTTLCAAGHRHCTITPSGDVVACSILPGSAGNLREHSFREIWEQSPWFARLRALRRGDVLACRGCSYQSACSRCPAQALVETGDLLGPLPSSCERAAMVSEIRATRAAAGPTEEPTSDAGAAGGAGARG